MVKIGLQFQAQLENVTGLKPEDDEFRWYLKLKCNSCGDVPKNWQYVNQTESSDLKGGRGSANAVIKCKLCSRENSIDIIKDSFSSYDFADSGKFKTLVAFDCRGLEPVDFSPRNGWTCKGYLAAEDNDGEEGKEGSDFNDVDLAEEEWADYDEKIEESTMISEMKSQFVKMK